MTGGPVSSPGPLAKAHAAATQAARRRLEAACNALQAALPAKFQPPQGQRLKASFDLSGVVQVRAAKDGALLAESEPGQPHTLRAGFVNFAPDCFASRLD